MKNMRKFLIACIAVVMLTTASCGLASSKINEICLIYTGGVTQDAEFEKLLKPGSNNNSIGLGSTSYCYNIDQRSYIADGDEGKGDTNPVEVVSSDTVRMGVEYQIYFTLNQQEEILREFHENLGVKTDAWTNEGWTQLLVEYVEPQIERALEQAALNYEWRQLYSSEETRKDFQKSVVSNVKTNLKDIIGNDYFCGPKYTGGDDPCGDFTFTVGKPYPLNGDIVTSVESEQRAAADTKAQAQKNTQIDEKAKGQRTLIDLYGEDNAALLELCGAGNCQNIIINGTDSPLAVAPQPQG